MSNTPDDTSQDDTGQDGTSRDVDPSKARAIIEAILLEKQRHHDEMQRHRHEMQVLACAAMAAGLNKDQVGDLTTCVECADEGPRPCSIGAHQPRCTSPDALIGPNELDAISYHLVLIC